MNEITTIEFTALAAISEPDHCCVLGCPEPDGHVGPHGTTCDCAACESLS